MSTVVWHCFNTTKSCEEGGVGHLETKCLTLTPQLVLIADRTDDQHSFFLLREKRPSPQESQFLWHSWSTDLKTQWQTVYLVRSGVRSLAHHLGRVAGLLRWLLGSDLMFTPGFEEFISKLFQCPSNCPRRDVSTRAFRLKTEFIISEDFAEGCNDPHFFTSDPIPISADTNTIAIPELCLL